MEIGWTWVATRWQRTAVNTEAKYLMLRHAFEELGCLRVELKTDLLNVRSQRAMERLGAVREGVLRSHMIVDDGRVRDTVYYSIIAAEWPLGDGNKLRLLTNLAGQKNPSPVKEFAGRSIWGGRPAAELTPWSVHWAVGDP